MITARNQAIGVSVAGALQLLWLMWACRANGISMRLRMPAWNADVKRLLALIWPAAAGAGAVQINLVISTALAASLLPHGSVTYIYMADRLNQLPLGLIGIGLGTVLLPTISRQLGAGEDADAMETQNRGMELALLLTLPAMRRAGALRRSRLPRRCSATASLTRATLPAPRRRWPHFRSACPAISSSRC